MSDCHPVLLPEGPFSRKQAMAATTAYLTAMSLLKMTMERISCWLSAMPKGSYAGGAGILSLTPENSLMCGSPVKGFSDNKRLHFIHQAASSPGDAPFHLYRQLIHKEQIMRLASRFGYANQIRRDRPLAREETDVPRPEYFWRRPAHLPQ